MPNFRPVQIVFKGALKVQDSFAVKISSRPCPFVKPFLKSYSSNFSTYSSAASLGMSPHRKLPIGVGKPPNILVLCEDSKRRVVISAILKSILCNDRYTIYEMQWDQLVAGGWADNTGLLVFAGSIPESRYNSSLHSFLGDGGRLFSWCCENTIFGSNHTSNGNGFVEEKQNAVLVYGSSETRPISLSSQLWGVSNDSNNIPNNFFPIFEEKDSEGNSHTLSASVVAKVKNTNEAAIMKLDEGEVGAKAVLSRVYFEDNKDDESSMALLTFLLQDIGLVCERITIPDYTHGYLMGDEKRVQEFISSVPSVIKQSNLSLEWIPRGEQGSIPSHDRFPIRIMNAPSNFSTSDYFDNLTTKELGRLVIYTDVITTGMNVFEGNPLKHGLVIVAGRQTAGRGRGKNVWLSPEGCVCFVFQLDVKWNSEMGQRLSLLQHICALGVVFAISSHKEINLRLKWPNDIYLDGQKIGGLLVQTRLEGTLSTITVGIGVNLSNKYPTACINSVLGDNDKLSNASLVSKCLSHIESMIDSIENGRVDQVLSDYVDNWIHNEDDVVKVEIGEGTFAECRICGIDEQGFLKVKDINSGRVSSVHPIGNSFDIANKLIFMKT